MRPEPLTSRERAFLDARQQARRASMGDPLPVSEYEASLLAKERAWIRLKRHPREEAVVDYAQERRVSALTGYLVDQMQRAFAESVVGSQAQRAANLDAGLPYLPEGITFATARPHLDRLSQEPLPWPELMWTWPELETANSRAASIFRSTWRPVTPDGRTLPSIAEARLGGAIRETLVVDLFAELRFEAIRRAWIAPLIALGLGVVAAEAAATAAAAAGASPEALAAAAAAGRIPFALRAAGGLPTFMGWSSGEFVDPITNMVLDTPSEGLPALDHVKTGLVNAGFALGGLPNAAAALYLLAEFLAGLFGDDHGFVQLVRSRLQEGI